MVEVAVAVRLVELELHRVKRLVEILTSSSRMDLKLSLPMRKLSQRASLDVGLLPYV